jgi:hypothetical protein
MHARIHDIPQRPWRYQPLLPLGNWIIHLPRAINPGGRGGGWGGQGSLADELELLTMLIEQGGMAANKVCRYYHMHVVAGLAAATICLYMHSTTYVYS